MVRVGEGRGEEERPSAVFLRVGVQPSHRFLGDVAGRIKLFRNGGAPALWRDIIVGQAVLRPDHCCRIAAPRLHPGDIGGADLVAVHRGERDVLETVKGRGDFAVRSLLPGPGPLFLIGVGGDRFRLARLGEGIVARLDPPLHRRRLSGHVLEVALADEGGAVALVPHQVHEGVLRQGERNAVVPNAVQRRHPAGHQGRPVGHAHRVGDIEAVKTDAACGDAVDMRRLQDRVAGAAQIVRPLLVGDNHQDIEAFPGGRPIDHSILRQWRAGPRAPGA